ncbi:MAG TPA: PASTA domain-containing protein [Thermoanaerobaculia bacterium]
MARFKSNYVVLAATLGTVACLLMAAPSAGAACGTVVTDHVPGLHALNCTLEPGSEEEWTVPAGITRPLFKVRGADSATARAGMIAAKLKAAAGETLRLVSGGEGDATSVMRGSTLLLAGGGGDDTENFAGEGAETTESRAPGEPLSGPVLGGSVYIEWYDAREPMDTSFRRPRVIVDIFDGEEASFSATGAWQTWTVPLGVSRATFQLFGGEGGSGGARGHVVAGLDVQPGETFHLWVGGPGADTIASRAGTFQTAVAAGGDSERPNYLPAGASDAWAVWEGGGPSSVPAPGALVVHYWPPLAGGGSSGSVAPPPAVSGCLVPNLRGKTRRAARRALRRANCALGTVRRRKSRVAGRGRVIAQRPAVGTKATPGRPVTIVLGTR